MLVTWIAVCSCYYLLMPALRHFIGRHRDLQRLGRHLGRGAPPSPAHRALAKKALPTRVAPRSVHLIWPTAAPRSSHSVPTGHREPVIDRKYGIGDLSHWLPSDGHIA